MSLPAMSLPESHGPYRGPERRAFVRFVRLRDARVRAANAPTNIFSVAVIREVSTSGLNLFLSARVKEGTILEIGPKGINFPRALLARVVHVTPQANGFLYGCELANSLSERELALLVV